MRGRTKSRIALILAALLTVGAVALLLTMAWMTERAANLSPNPNHVALHESANSGEVADDDGFEDVDWEYWRSVNPDVIGWITVPGTDIDYPVVQGHEDDPGHYLTYDVYGSWNYHGVPYLSWACREGGLLGSGNALVFGHHLRDGTMFSALANFSEAGYAWEHFPILIQTPDAKARLTVLAVDVVDANRTKVRTSFAEGLDHALWLSEVTADADVDFTEEGFNFGSVGNVVTLCTCSYNYWGNERTLVICAVEMID